MANHHHLQLYADETRVLESNTDIKGEPHTEASPGRLSRLLTKNDWLHETEGDGSIFMSERY